MEPPATFTAAQLATALGLKRQAAQHHLHAIPPAAAVKLVRGKEAATWNLSQLPPALHQPIMAEFATGNYRTPEDVVNFPRRPAPPPLPLDQICEADIQAATKLREALRPWLIRRNDATLTAAEREARGLEDYRRHIGSRITARYWRELIARTLRRAAGFADWNNLALYLPARPKAKAAPADAVSEALAEDFTDLENFIRECGNPHHPTKDERAGLWKLALVKFGELVRAGQSERTAGRRVRQFLFARAKFLSASRDALRKAFEQRLANGIEDGRKNNGDRANYPESDLTRLRNSAFAKNGKRIDTAWREEYPHLSEYTRNRHPFKPRCPITLYRAVNRLLVDACHAADTSERELQNLVGRLKLNHDGIPSMARWSFDDVTSNVQVSFRSRDGTQSLILPQIVAGMDVESRFIVGWAKSNDKGPTSRLVCAAVKDSFIKHGVPTSEIGLENGFVFGGALNIVGKEDEQGRMIVAGLAQYGCKVRHYHPHNPTSKADLENSFNLLQQRMERHPGWGGRIQMLDASDEFKRQERLINSGKVPASEFRYTFEQFTRVFNDIVEEYNNTPQFYGRLKGATPAEAFEALKDHSNPPTQFDNKLLCLLDEKYRVLVKASGVKFPHYGKTIRVVGGELPDHIGEEMWALVDRTDDSLVSFVSLDMKTRFTVEVLPEPSADESRIATSSGVLADAQRKLGQQKRGIKDKVAALRLEYGDPRKDLLARYRGETTALPNMPEGTTRRVILNGRLESAQTEIAAQRQAIKTERRQNTVSKTKAGRLGIPVAMVRNDARSRRAIELAEEAAREADRLESSPEIKP